MDRDTLSLLRRFLRLWAVLLAAPAAAAVPLLDAYGSLPTIEQATLSPDGSKIAFVKTTQDWRVLAVFDVDGEKFICGIRVGDVKLRSVEWADNDHLLLTTASSLMPMELSGERTEWHVMSVYNVKTKELSGLLNHVVGNTSTMNVVFGRPVVQHKGSETLLYVHGIYVTDRTESALFRINLNTNAELLIKQGNERTNEWLVDDTGDIVAEQDYNEGERRWAIRLLHDGHVQQTVSGIAPIDAPDILGLTAAGDAIVVALTDTDGVTWKFLMLKDGTWGAEIGANESLTGLILRDGSLRMLGTAFIGDSTRYRFVDRSVQDAWNWIEGVFGFQRVELVSAQTSPKR
jgi:hypothetical protein